MKIMPKIIGYSNVTLLFTVFHNIHTRNIVFISCGALHHLTAPVYEHQVKRFVFRCLMFSDEKKCVVFFCLVPKNPTVG